ncbi:MAG: peptidylprolyl isomerase [Campylobacteraceae bacterium]
MRKLILGTFAVAAAISLNAAVLATVDGQSVTDEDVALLLRNTPGAEYTTLPADIKQQVLDQAIDRKILMANAVKSGIEKDKEYIDAINNIKNEVALEIWMKKEFDKIKVAESKTKAYYDANPNSFMQPERVKASHILVDTEADATKLIKELSGLKGEKLADKFADLARKNSKDPGGQNGGELGWFAQNQMVKPFADAAFALKKGEVSAKPVQTQFGYHIILIEDKQAPSKIEYNDVKANIEGMLKAEEFKTAVTDQVKKLREKAKIDIKK